MDEKTAEEISPLKVLIEPDNQPNTEYRSLDTVSSTSTSIMKEACNAEPSPATNDITKAIVSDEKGEPEDTSDNVQLMVTSQNEVKEPTINETPLLEQTCDTELDETNISKTKGTVDNNTVGGSSTSIKEEKTDSVAVISVDKITKPVVSDTQCLEQTCNTQLSGSTFNSTTNNVVSDKLCPVNIVAKEEKSISATETGLDEQLCALPDSEDSLVIDMEEQDTCNEHNEEKSCKTQHAGCGTESVMINNDTSTKNESIDNINQDTVDSDQKTLNQLPGNRSKGDTVTLYRTCGDRDSDDSISTTSSDDDSSSSDDETESDIEISSSESEKETETTRVSVKARPFGNVRTKGEFSLEDLPPLEDMKITLPEDVQLEEIGVVSSIIDVLVVIQSHRGLAALDEGSLLFTDKHQVIGQIFETLGPVTAPLYSVRYNKCEDIEHLGLQVGKNIYFVPMADGYTRYVFVDQLRRLKGSDASWEHNNEPPEKFLDYSDDEEERKFKAKQRGKNTNAESEQGDEVATPKKKRPSKAKYHRHEDRGRGRGMNRGHFGGRGGVRPDIPCWPPQSRGFNQNYGQFRQRPPWMSRGHPPVGSRFLWKPRLPPPFMGPGWMPERPFMPGQRLPTNAGTPVPSMSVPSPHLAGMSTEPQQIHHTPYINQSAANRPNVPLDTRYIQNSSTQQHISTVPNGHGPMYPRGPPLHHFTFGQPPPQH